MPIGKSQFWQIARTNRHKLVATSCPAYFSAPHCFQEIPAYDFAKNQNAPSALGFSTIL
jgi:hypothetical protein